MAGLLEEGLSEVTLPGLALSHPERLVLLALLPALAFAWWRWPPPLGAGRRRLALAIRMALVALIVLSLAGPRAVTVPSHRAVVAVVDLSDSTRGARDAEAAAVSSLAGARRPGDLFGVVTFGGDAMVEVPPTQTPFFDTFHTRPAPGNTDIAGALELAAGIIPDGYARQLVLISDGRQTAGDAAATVAALRQGGTRVDVYPAGSEPKAEALVLGVQAPSQLPTGQKGRVKIELSANAAASGTLELSVDKEAVLSAPVALKPGVTVEMFQVGPLPAGLHQVQALLSVSPDTYSQNNVGAAVIRVVGPPQVLVLEGAPGAGDNVVRALGAAGMTVTRQPAGQAPTDPASLGRFDSIVIVDAPADAFPPGALTAIQASVKELGHGLGTFGGSESYGPGGWQGTPLEAALPVSMELPPDRQKPRVAVGIVMETMEDPQADRVAIGAAQALVRQLSPQDQVAVTDGAQGFAVPLTRVGNGRAVESKLAQAQLGDSPSYLPFIQMAAQALERTNAPLKHLVVLGDGDATPSGVAEYLAGLRAQGITTSAIGVNTHGSQQLMATMADIARAGGGRYFESDDPSQVPQMLLDESRASLRPWFQSFSFVPSLVSAGDLLQGLPLDQLPPLGGYVVTTPKPGGEVYLESPKSDPVLAAWQYGLGRAVAWTSDTEGRWTSGFLRSAFSGRLFARLVAWSLPEAAAGGLQVQTVVTGEGVTATVSGPAQGGSLELSGITPQGKGFQIQLAAVAPGRWQGRLPSAGTGVYMMRATLVRSGLVRAKAEAAAVVPFSPEYLSLGRDDGFLAELAHQGGRLLASPAGAWSQPVVGVPTSGELALALLVLVALLWPLDVTVRRLLLSPREVALTLWELVRLRPPSRVELAASPELAMLGRRLERHRKAQRPSPDSGPPAVPPSPAGRPAPRASAPREAGAPDQDISERLLELKRRRRPGA